MSQLLAQSVIIMAQAMTALLTRRKCTKVALLLCTCVILSQLLVVQFPHAEYPISESPKRLNRYIEYVMGSEFEQLTDDQKETLQDNCISVKDVQNLTMCLYPPTMDIISDMIRQTGAWERDITRLILQALVLFENPLFVDLGANLGAHGLNVALKGHKVLAVEPLIFNYLRLWQSANASGILDRFTIVRNALSNVRTTVVLKAFMKKNFGSVHVVESAKAKSTSDRLNVNTALLSDVLTEALDGQRNRSSGPLDIVMKIDIEGQECKTFVGSPKSLAPNSDYAIHLIVMEWRFSDVGSSCSRAQISAMTQIIAESGFIPYGVRNRDELDVHSSKDWPTLDMMWVHRSFVQTFLPLAVALRES